MNDYVTLTHDDPELQRYLLGSFSRHLRALPVESFLQHSNRARYTFRVVPIEEINKPYWWKVYFKACRPELLGLTLGPFLVTGLWTAKHLSGVTPLWTFVSAAFGLFFVHVAAFLFNDFRDHMAGVDLANRKRGSQVIQMGWASAKEVRRWAFVNALLALLFGAPSLWLGGKPLVLVTLLGAIIVLLLSWGPLTLARYGLTDLLIFMGLGPLLSIAGSVSLTLNYSPQVIWLGTAFGSLAVLALQIRHLENLFRAGRESFRTFIGGVNFDHAKRVMLAQIFFVASIQILCAIETLHWVGCIGMAFALAPMVGIFESVRKAASPVSSQLVHMGRRIVIAQFVLLAWWGTALWI